jgi:hypothetical protein
MRPRGGIIGASVTPTVSAASGVWTLRESENYTRFASFPGAIVTPTDVSIVSNLAGWWDASDASTIYDATSGGSLVASGGSVARWQDKSGNSRHATQATSGKRPVRRTAQQNGLSTIEFSAGSSQAIGVSSSTATFQFLHSTTFTVFLVAKVGTSSSTNALNPLFSTIQTLGNNPGCAYYHDDRSFIPRSNTIVQSVRHNSDVLLSFITPDSFFSAGAFGVLTVTGNCGNGTTTASTTLYNTANSSASSASSSSVMASTSAAANDLTFGAIPSQFWMSGQIAEIIIYNVVLSDAYRDGVRAYLKAKWGIA